jgi:hypothetical protein
VLGDTVSKADGGAFLNAVSIDNINIDGNTISSTDTNGNITLDPDGTGDTIIASGNVGIGTSSPASIAHALHATSPKLTLERDSTSLANNNVIGEIAMAHKDSNDAGTAVRIIGRAEGTAGAAGLAFNTGTPSSISEAVRIDSSGRVAVNTTSPSSSFKMTVQSDSTVGSLRMNGPTTNGYYASIIAMPNGSTYGMQFLHNGSNVGNIRINASSTSYNTSSDYRLKEAVVDMTGAIDRVKQLAPKRFNFIADPDDTTVDGFLAHEAQSVVPEAVSGTHNEVDADGNAVMQGIDQSKLVPLLTGALQEAIAKIETLETKVAALEAAE